MAEKSPRKPRRKKSPAPIVAAVVEVEAAPPAPTHADIARRAHELFTARGGPALDNWLTAERELSG